MTIKESTIIGYVNRFNRISFDLLSKDRNRICYLLYHYFKNFDLKVRVQLLETVQSALADYAHRHEMSFDDMVTDREPSLSDSDILIVRSFPIWESINKPDDYLRSIRNVKCVIDLCGTARPRGNVDAGFVNVTNLYEPINISDYLNNKYEYNPKL